jgi:isoquinoline 1-oxidoreductase subunit beta
VENKYQIADFHVSVHQPTVDVPVYVWRSVGYTHNTFVLETLLDELAIRAKTDPIEYHLKLLSPDALKLRRVLTLLQEKSAWRSNLPPNHAVGIASADYLDTGIVCAAEVSIEDNRPRIHRVTVCIDCGLPVNLLSIEARCQGAIGLGLTQLVELGAISLKQGQVEQSNFDGFRPPNITDAPVAIDVHIASSTDEPTGVGEAAVPIISPAVVNALSRLTGKRYRSLPLKNV